MATLEIRALRKTFGGVVALAGVDLTVRSEEILGVIGPNGSGKTTLFNTVCGVHRPNSGTVHWNGVDISLQARLAGGVLITGGLSTGKTTTDNCDVVAKVDNPSQYNCKLETPFLPQVKFGGSYTLPLGVQVSGTLQSFWGPSIAANATFTNAQIAPSLGRNLAAGPTAVASVQILPAFQQYEDRISQLDLRLSKVLKIGRSRLSVDLDAYNVFNASPILAETTVFGASFLKPSTILGARLFKIGGQFEF